MKHLMLISLTIFSAQIFAQSFEPGLWKFKSKLNVSMLSLPESASEECITAKQAKDAKETIEKELKKQGCKITEWIVKNKNLDASISCDNINFNAAGKLGGEFSRKTYNLKGEAKGKIKKTLPATAKINLSGEWVKECTKTQ